MLTVRTQISKIEDEKQAKVFISIKSDIEDYSCKSVIFNGFTVTQAGYSAFTPCGLVFDATLSVNTYEIWSQEPEDLVKQIHGAVEEFNNSQNRGRPIPTDYDITSREKARWVAAITKTQGLCILESIIQEYNKIII